MYGQYDPKPFETDLSIYKFLRMTQKGYCQSELLSKWSKSQFFIPNHGIDEHRLKKQFCVKKLHEKHSILSQPRLGFIV